VGLDNNSAYYFVIIPINASSVVGVSSGLCQRQHTTTVDYVKRSGCGGHVERGNNARRVVFHIDIDWNTDGGAIDDGSLTNQSTSPTYISGLSSNIKLLFHDYALLHASVVAGYY
jgi:hypothetical protein